MSSIHITPASVADLKPEEHNFQLEDMAMGQERIRYESLQLDNDMKSLGYFKDLATTLCKSGAIKAQDDSDPWSMAVLKMQLGKEMGMPPGQALKDVYIIKGVPSVSAHFKAQKMRAAGYSWTFTKHDETECSVILAYKGREIGPVSYTIEDARRAKLVKDDKDESNWMKTPKNMLFARMISNAQRWFAPETQGAGYPTPEEFDLDAVIASTMQQQTHQRTDALAGRLVAANGKTAEQATI